MITLESSEQSRALNTSSSDVSSSETLCQVIHDVEDASEIKKRSVVISGHRTSISLENVFWSSLRTLAAGRGISVNRLVTDIDKKRSGNLSSAIRTFVLLEATRP